MAHSIAEHFPEFYSQKATEMPSIIEWSNLDECICIGSLYKVVVHDNRYSMLETLATPLLR